ncbi:MAG: hypothetical protein WBM17_14635 [Anaerolineales bacterium]
MKKPRPHRLIPAALPVAIFSLLFFVQPASAKTAPSEEFPQKNAWTRITPSVVWCGENASTVTIEVHIVGRNDVRKAWAIYRDEQGKEPPMDSLDDNNPGRLFDDGSHGDVLAGDNIFTRSGIVLPCNKYMAEVQGWSTWLGFLRVELADGTRQGNNYGMFAGQVDSKYKKTFAVRDLGNHLSASAYAFFIEDPDHSVIDDYPVANVVCGSKNYEAYRKLYSVFPDAFDLALVTPGMQIFRPGNLSENVPYDVLVSNSVQYIGLNISDNSAAFGSSGRLKSVVYHSFGSLAIATHEIGHTWGMHLGASLGLIDPEDGSAPQAHWNPMTDIGGQMSGYYSDTSGNTGHFHDNGDGTWSFIPNWEQEPYSPLDLYAMGLIPAQEIPSIHILQSPNLSDLKRITPASYRTVSMDQIVNAAGGPRSPSAAEAQKDYALAFIVTQDTAYNDAAYAFFSLMSYIMMSKDPPDMRTYFASFYWATGGRATLNTRLPVDVPEPVIFPGPTLNPTVTPDPDQAGNHAAETKQAYLTQNAETKPSQNTPATAIPQATASSAPEKSSKPVSGSPLCNCPLIVGGLTILPGAWAAVRRKKQKL